MLQLDSVEIMSRISRKVGRDESWFRIDKDNLSETTRNARRFVSITDYIEEQGYGYVGTCTSRDASTPKRVRDKIEKIIENIASNNSVNEYFNVYCSFHEKTQEPIGLFGIEPWGFGFIPGTNYPNDKFLVPLTLQPTAEKERIDGAARIQGLHWFGDVSQPISYRDVVPSQQTFADFFKDVHKFMEDLGTARV
ncbi:MAG: hypothetical protein M1151_05395 [Candidatus Thermoplasmatota archaeon]|jgi:hypothetical protein|nr:hypothetical protein [Candidatus Thermoplasmatota archaeon]